MQLAQTEIGVFNPVLVEIGFATGAEPFTVTVIEELVHETGYKLHMVYLKVVVPTKVAVGVKVTIPVVVLTEAIPGDVPIVIDKDDGFTGPPLVAHKAQTVTGVFTLVTVVIGVAMGGKPVTLTVINALVHDTGNKLQME